MTRMISPRLLSALALLAFGCQKGGSGTASPLRLGYFPNVTHAQALVGSADGTFQKALGMTPLEELRFNAGPSAMEALLGGSVDVCYVGGGPAINAYLKSSGTSLRIIAGSASGGAVLVARTAKTPEALRGKKVASPQLGNTQDIALRVFLQSKGLRVVANPGEGDVTVFPISNPDIFALFRRGELEAAWVPEPWGARLIAEAGAHLLVDERDLWEGRQFPSTVLVASAKALRHRREQVKALLRAHLALTARWKADPGAFAALTNQAYGKLTQHPLSAEVLKDAFSRLEPTAEPLEKQLVLSAKQAHALGFTKSEDVSGLVDSSLLEELRAEAR